MNTQDFVQAISAFADSPVDVDLQKGDLVAQIHEDIVEAKLTTSSGDIVVTEVGSEPMSAFRWLTRRVARLPILAEKILEAVPEEPNFVEPQGSLSRQDPGSDVLGEVDSNSASNQVIEYLNEGLLGVSKILYLTSDAGEGKSTLINYMARSQAMRYKKGIADWLLVPIHLGGRPFMALDDVVAADLTNRFRFLMYYDAFAELIKLNAIVPALDGFEEVFLETGSGEAVSALGNLINRLGGSGRVLIAARRAYFEVRSFASQARMFDSIGDNAGAVFERLALHRWDKEQFLDYATKAGIRKPSELYEVVEGRLGSSHPLLTRAVLVKKLVEESDKLDLNSLVERLGTKPEDYFYQFVGAIIEREAHSKWIDRSARDSAATPLLSISEHHMLLAAVALEMWNTQSHYMRDDYLDMLADLFCTEHEKSASVSRQVKERLHQHSLLTTAAGSSRKLAFDHEDFREFYLGEAIGREIRNAGMAALGTILGVASLPERTCDAAIAFLKRQERDYLPQIEKLLEIGRNSLVTSYEKENSGALAIRLMDGVDLSQVLVLGNSFPSGALANRKLNGIKFQGCKFNSQDISSCQFENCEFDECEFDRLVTGDKVIANNSLLVQSNIGSICHQPSDSLHFSPADVAREIMRVGFELDNGGEQVQLDLEGAEVDDRIQAAEQALRAFMRATHLNESIFKLRLGQSFGFFHDSVLPALIEHGVIREVEYKGAGVQKRFKLTVPMKNIEPAIKQASNWDEFIRVLTGDI